MILHDEAAREAVVFGEIERTKVDIEDLLAVSTLKVLVVAGAGGFEAAFAGGEDDRVDELAFLEELQRAIDGGDPDFGEVLAGALVDFGHGEGAGGIADDAQDGIALAGLALAEGGVLVERAVMLVVVAHGIAG